jgi:hypothetical protein
MEYVKKEHFHMSDKEVIKLIVAGGRDFRDYRYLKQECDYMLSVLLQTHRIEIVSGGARGADTLALEYANEHGYIVTVMKANWDKNGKSAGFIRNKEMANYASHLIAFHDGQSRGTAHMIKIANEGGLKCRVIEY